ncbi:MAG: PQQ-like beta-propeller repeat protein [Anaerolineales bacterium]|jgi:hypothetical protein|nr:PQQ-like beta-propeller repeat protein [Anaerolineales bacterium]
MKKLAISTLNYITLCGLFLGASILSLGALPFNTSAATTTITLPVLWSAGGLSAGNDGAGQAARIATDLSGNLAIVSGPYLGRDLAVTSYTASGSFRWRGSVSPNSGTFAGDWIAAAPNGDFLAVGHNSDARGNPIAITLVRYATDGALQWRVDLARTLPSVARLLVDSGGNSYLAFNSIGEGQDIQLNKYNASGALLWSQVISTGPLSNDIAASLVLSPDETDVVLTGGISGGATWITAAYNSVSGDRKWLVTAGEGVAARDLIVDANRVYVTGQGNVGTSGYLTVVAYDRATGARLWRTDVNPSTCCASGSRIALAPDGSLVVAGQTSSGGYFDWWIVAFNANGTVKWKLMRDAAVTGDELPAAILTLADGTTVVSGIGGPVVRDALGNSYLQGVTAGYSSNGTLLWEAFAKLPAVWATALPNGDLCATGGYDALVTCWRPSGGVVSTPTPTSLPTNTPTAGPTSTPTSTPIPPTPTATPPASTSTGFVSPSANSAQTSSAGDNNGYETNPANAYANDASFATDTNSGTNTNLSCTNSGKDKHYYTNYNFNLPVSATIQGIQVRLDARIDATKGLPKICAQLSWDNGVTWTTAKSTANLTTTEKTYFLGGPSDTWGRAWSTNNFSNPNFRLRIIHVASDISRDFFLDYVAVNITYQP